MELEKEEQVKPQISRGKETQLTLEQHGFELHRSTHMQIFSINTLEKI